MAKPIEVSMSHAETLSLALYELKRLINANAPIGLNDEQKASTLRDIEQLDKLIKIT